MERTTLSFTFENIITVCVMVFIGFTVFGVLGRLAYSATGANNG